MRLNNWHRRIWSNSREWLLHCELNVGQSAIVKKGKVRKRLLLHGNKNSAIRYSSRNAKKCFVSCCSHRNVSRWFQGQGSSCPTPHSLSSVARSFLRCRGPPFRPSMSVRPLTLYSSSFSISFILPRKRRTDTEAKETSKSYFSLRLYNKFFFCSHFSELWGLETSAPGFTTEVRVKTWIGVSC